MLLFVGSWIPHEVVQLVTRFVCHLSQDIPWTDIQQLLVLIDQVNPCHAIQRHVTEAL